MIFFPYKSLLYFQRSPVTRHRRASYMLCKLHYAVPSQLEFGPPVHRLVIWLVTSIGCGNLKKLPQSQTDTKSYQGRTKYSMMQSRTPRSKIHVDWRGQKEQLCLKPNCNQIATAFNTKIRSTLIFAKISNKKNRRAALSVVSWRLVTMFLPCFCLTVVEYSSRY